MSTRKCGECTLCCRVLPVADISKPAATPCPHQFSKGCRVYPTRPNSCRLWSCAWLADDSFPLPRPDRCGYVVDTSPDYCTIEGVKVSVVQIWLDARRPFFDITPAVAEWPTELWRTREQIALVRFDPVRAKVVLPPVVTGEGWIISGSDLAPIQHSPEQILAAMRELQQRRKTRG